jgi:glucans biosynthesis protein
MDVSLTLYPRADLPTVGLAPLTSMFLFGPGSRRFPQELRRAAYGSEGLAILNGAGERLWRPLNNPKRLQMSAFLDRDPKGFGLIQRSRALSDFDDLDARFERRPSAWIEPQGKWGFGSVELVEIPSEEDIHDNIVAFWRPAEPLAKNKVHEFTYRLYWTSAIPSDWPGAIVHQTRTGPGKRSGTFRYSVDFANVGLPAGSELPATQLTASSGQVSGAAVKPYPEIGGVRVGFDFEPKGAEIAELRLALRSNDKRISEVWLQRWTRD